MVGKNCAEIIVIALGGLLLSSCVVMEEKFNAEKARSLNFQRLLAQEEKRTAELDSEVKRTKREFSEIEARNRELTAQLQAVREQSARVQEEAEAVKEAMLLERKAKEHGRTGTGSLAKVKPPEISPQVMQDPLVSDAGTLNPAIEKNVAMYHVVKPGETLFRISRKYGVEVEKVKKWNKLPDDIIEVGQKLIVGYE